MRANVAILVVGLILFLGIHSLRIVAPAWRDGVAARLGALPFKGVYSIVSLVGFGLIVWGFSKAAADASFLYLPPFWLRQFTALLMAPALILVVASALPPGRIKHAVRHPLLIATMLWAVAHLFVNGEWASVVLFGAFLIWAILDLFTQPAGSESPRTPDSAASDIAAVVVGLALYGALVWRLHEWAFGVRPML
jgi:uncharacterized membrane protein